MDFLHVKVLPALDLLRSSRMRQNHGMRQFRIQLSECAFMAVIRLLLRYDNNIWRRYFGEVLDICARGMSGEGEPWREDDGLALEPGIGEDCEFAGLVRSGKGQEEGRVRVQALGGEHRC
jgi:hypothetical protein